MRTTSACRRSFLVALAAGLPLVFAIGSGTTSCTGDDPVLSQTQTPDGSSPDGNAPTSEAATEAAADGGVILDTRLQIAVAASATCALRADGGVYCWGADSCGELGLGNTNPGGSRPLRTALPVPAARVVAGSGHFCALGRDGSVWCWGLNKFGQLGHPLADDPIDPACDANGSSSTTPKRVAGIDGAVEIAAGINHTCVRKADSSVWCWGGNDTRQLGHDSTQDVGCGGGSICNPKPTQVKGLTADALALGSFHSCARAQGTIVCWGSNQFDELGHPQGQSDDIQTIGQVTANPVPKPITNGIAAIDVVAGEDFTCVTTVAKTVACWGLDNLGQLGAPFDAGMSTSQAVAVPGIDKAIVLGLGSTHGCAAWLNGLSCWGNDEYGQAGPNGEGGATTGPVLFPGDAFKTVAQIAAKSHTCALTATGTVLCWGRNDHGQLGHDPATDVMSCGTGCPMNSTPTIVADLP